MVFRLVMKFSEREQYLNKKVKNQHKKTIRFYIFEYMSKFSNHHICSFKDGNTSIECNQLNSDNYRVNYTQTSGLPHSV